MLHDMQKKIHPLTKGVSPHEWLMRMIRTGQIGSVPPPPAKKIAEKLAFGSKPGSVTSRVR